MQYKSLQKKILFTTALLCASILGTAPLAQADSSLGEVTYDNFKYRTKTITFTAFNADGSKGEISIRDLPNTPQGMGVKGGEGIELEHADGKSEAIVVDFHNLEIESVEVVFAWRNSKEVAKASFLRHGKEISSVEISGEGDTKIGKPRLLKPKNSQTFDAIRFTAPSTGDDYLIYSMTVNPKESNIAMNSFNDAEELLELLKEGGDVNALTISNDTPLMTAARLKSPKAIKLLLDNGAFPDVKNLSGDTPLSILYDNTSTANQTWRECVALLKEAGAKLGEGISPKEAGIIKYKVEKNTLDTYDTNHNFYKDNFWRVATPQDVKQSMIETDDLSGADRDFHGRSVLTIAATHCTDIEVMKLFKDSVPDEYGNIIAAAQNPNPEILKMMIDNVPPDYESGYFDEAAIKAGQANLTENMRLIISKAPEVRYRTKETPPYVTTTPFLVEFAPTVGRMDRVAVNKFLQDTPLKYGNGHYFFGKFGSRSTLEEVREYVNYEFSDLNSTFEWGSSPEMSGFNGDTILEFGLRYGSLKPEVVKFMVENGAKITSTALHRVEDVETMKAFIEVGAKLDGLTLLHRWHYYYISPEFVQLVLENGVLPDLKDKFGDTPLSLVYADPHNMTDIEGIVKVLKDAGAKLGEGRTAKEAGLITYKVKKNTEKSYSPTHNYNIEDFWQVASLKDVEQSFIKGENLNDFSLPNDDPEYGKSSILAKAIYNNTDLNVIKFLVKNGAKIGPSAVVNAAINENLDILKYLIDNGGDVNSESHYTAVGAASKAGLKEHVLYLMGKGADINESPYTVGNALCLARRQNSARPDKQAVEKILEDAGGEEFCGYM